MSNVEMFKYYASKLNLSKPQLEAVTDCFKTLCESSYADELRHYSETGIDGYSVREIAEKAGANISSYHTVNGKTEFKAEFSREKPNPMADSSITVKVTVYEDEGYGEMGLIGGSPITFQSLDDCAGLLDAIKYKYGISNGDSENQVYKFIEFYAEENNRIFPTGPNYYFKVIEPAELGGVYRVTDAIFDARYEHPEYDDKADKLYAMKKIANGEIEPLSNTKWFDGPTGMKTKEYEIPSNYEPSPL